MVDTIRVKLEKCEVWPSAQITLEQGEIDMKTGELYESELWTDNSGKVVFGKKGKLNTDLFQLTIKPEPVGFRVQLSLPKVIDGKRNVFPLESGEIAKQAIDKVESSLRELGIATDLSSAKLHRLDIFKNGMMDYPPNYYYPILRSFEGGRALDRRDLPGGCYFENSQREWCFYNKIEELRTMHKGISVSDLPKNILRSECRLLNSKVVWRESRIDTVDTLTKRWNDLQSIYSKELSQMVLKKRVTPSLIIEEVGRLRMIKDIGGYGWSKVKAKYGLLYFCSKYTKEEFEKIIKDTFESRFITRRAVREFSEALLEFSRFDSPEVKTSDLLNELYVKLVA